MLTASASAAPPVAAGSKRAGAPQGMSTLLAWLGEVKAPPATGAPPHDIDRGLQMLAMAAQQYGFDRWVTAIAGDAQSQPLVVPASTAGVSLSESPTVPRVASSLRVFFRDLIARGWDETSPVWFSKNNPAVQISDDWGTGSNFMALQLPGFMVEHFATIGRQRHQASLNSEFGNRFLATSPYEEGYRQALIATGRAMQKVGLPDTSIQSVMDIAVCSHTNRHSNQDAGDDVAAPAADAPGA